MWLSVTQWVIYNFEFLRENLCKPVNPDLRCALFFPSFLFENKLNTTEREAQLMPTLNELHRLQVGVSFKGRFYEKLYDVGIDTWQASFEITLTHAR